MPNFERQPEASLTDRLPISHEEFAALAVGVGIEKKAYAPVLLDLRNQDSFTEYFAILSANNPRQVASIAEGIKLFFKTNFGLRPVTVDGMESLDWVLLDYGFLFVHVFQKETRERYKLEEMWSKARLVPSEESTFRELVSKYELSLNS